ncbi:MAG: ATP-dependent zinc metalloprotease FtsH [Candidatus Magasanikbacteria bacterium GW2011_GWC2_40_17]|uniref:ATP-dependent zinc metalloprotease FtsH n=1 Tax=Candidatus Magasanikbacteria bacterium GW2011_GWA2_42_32 TaxID=1619039 RepID=A0A0G1A7Z4_9BACT|nr:MAG: ATP-dependent zinc metalloprotease FtsH [Candidatus Magasanikbacteria bacterium GW2011_GWC2_40_17]KKS57162.1 MAG: ATP-dependent zinc metalloprotease FtsH [Candidatus Magasanikbacteria bacterium GW2011_GWA2_42_32]OGH85317.1 MAG: cell division protein FtsH [Candidatus Magasanikbacteria bacterium RIFOXYB2_FULL_38_10]
MSPFVKNLLLFVGVLVVLSLVFGGFSANKTKVDQVSLDKIIAELQTQDIKKIEVEGDVLRATLKNDTVQEAKKEAGDTLSSLVKNYNVDQAKLKDVQVSIKNDHGWAFWISNLLPFVLPFLLLGVLLYFMTRQVQGVNSRAMGFGQSTARETGKDDKNKKTFKDVAGAREAKEELQEVVEFLITPKRFAEMGAKIPKGVLLMGAPGTGKTLLAKAVAGEANVPFLHMSGSEFVEMFVGVGASRVRDLFKRAKKEAPAIVFIDEIDAVGRRRGAGLGGSHDEREQTLNQILVEMDGFEPNLGVIVIAATNRPDVLDPALLRPGRFDRRVIIDMPDIQDREEILFVHAKGKPLAKNVSLRKIAERTPGFSGADLANLLNEAAILAVRRGKKQVGEEEILESIEKVILGPEKKSRVMTEKDKTMTAYHEAGHAVVANFLPGCDPVRKVSIVGRGLAGGYTLSMPEKDVHYQTLSKMKDNLSMMLGGFMAEKIIYGEDQLSTGPSSDLKKVTQSVTSMVMRFGMSDKLGPRMFADNEELIFLAQEIHEKKSYSEKTAELIDAEISRILEEAKNKAGEIIGRYRVQMDKLVKVLLEKEVVEQEEFKEIMKG